MELVQFRVSRQIVVVVVIVVVIEIEIVVASESVIGRDWVIDYDNDYDNDNEARHAVAGARVRFPVMTDHQLLITDPPALPFTSP